MDTVHVFTSKAEKYARYRWDYAPEAVRTLIETSGISGQSTVADIGAGTGILTRHLAASAGRILAVEPNPAMRRLAKAALETFPTCAVIAGRAEAVPVADHSLDLVTVAEAFNWFDPAPTRAELMRILKPDGWLVKLHNSGTDAEMAQALDGVYPKETDTEALMPGLGTPVDFYFGGHDFLRQSFSFDVQDTWEAFLGALASASFAPDESSQYYAWFTRAVRGVFDRFNTDGLVTMHGITELCMGRIHSE